MSDKMDEHSFSIEIKSEENVQKMSFAIRENNRVFFEGSLGKLLRIFMVEDMMLQVEGVHGTMRMDIRKEELQKCFITKNNLEPEKP